ncbi:hypothetical protein SLE2022_102410 [Rubroshorea leprosula]
MNTPWLCGQNPLLSWLEREYYRSIDNLTLTLSTPNFSVLSRIQFAKALILLSHFSEGFRTIAHDQEVHHQRPASSYHPLEFHSFFFLDTARHGMAWQNIVFGPT